MPHHRFLAASLLSLAAACGAPDTGSDDPVPTPEPRAAEAPSAPAQDEAASDVLAVLRGDDRFSTFVAAAEAAGIEAELNAASVTVFAPTNDAFAALPAGTVESLMKPEYRSELADVLRYHLLPGVVTAEGVGASAATETANGDTVSVGRSGGIVTVGDAVVIDADIDASNGIVHAIDAMLIPPA